MRALTTLALLTGSLLGSAAPALAGSWAGPAPCGPTAFDCAPNVWVSHSETVTDDVLVSVDQPMGHLRSVDYRRSPHVSITRIHAQHGVPGLEDAPSGFGGPACHPESTQYCRTDAAPLPAARPAPFVAQPMAATVIAQPVVAQPVMAAPAPALRQWTASYNDDPSRFQPRQYGSLDFVPGVAHVPTSWVDRDPARAQASLNASGAGGIAPGPQTGLTRIPDDTPGPMIPVTQFMAPHPVQPGSVVQPGPASHAPEVAVNVIRHAPGAPVPAPLMPTYPHGVPANYGAVPAPVVPAPVVSAPVMPAPVLSAPMVQAPAVSGFAGVSPSGVAVPDLAPAYPARPGLPMTAGDGIYASPVAADGTYWEKVSGTTLMGDTVATQVICKRRLETEVVNPVVGVPYPVPVHDMCGPVPHAAHGPVQGPSAHFTHGLAGGR